MADSTSLLSRAYLRLRALKGLSKSRKEVEFRYPVDDILNRAKLGADAVYPSDIIQAFGTALLGAEVFDRRGRPRYPTLDTSIFLVPPGFTPKRMDRLVELGREPLYFDVDLHTTIGGFRSRMPWMVSAMGSTDVANRHGVEVSNAAAQAGVPMGIGENVVTMRGYAKRRTKLPCFKERLLGYLEHVENDVGGVIIQQSVEDADAELWNEVYADPEVAPYVKRGLIGFEVKLGQGAKAGMGGEVRIDREKAIELADKFSFEHDPREVVKEKYERHSAPGTFSAEILKSQVRLVRNNYPGVKVWVKTGAYRDVAEQAVVAADAGAAGFVVDGKEGGTGMSPSAALKDLGLPLLGCIARMRRVEDKLGDMSVIYSGGTRGGADVVKVCALGGTAVAMGRPTIVAAQAHGVQGVKNLIESIRLETMMLTSAVGKYSAADLAGEDLVANDPDVAKALGIAWMLD